MADRTEIKIRGYHLDFYGHVNNARYLEFLEEARWALFENRMDLKRWAKRGVAFFVVNINISYKRPVTLGDVITVRTTLGKVGGRSAVLNQKVVLEGTDTLVAEADVTFVLADDSGKAVPIEGELRALVETLAVAE